ncbi:SLATT domain-containing protein [Pandoraea sp. PE-S2T-3]|uniref:SLATT domain-containing protein n=1 Tax=Pandoraea sp. PE-S2T-3 TaxID=1986993 RepID=UPI0015950CE8
MKDFLLNLRQRAWCTAGARYNAARRLRIREWVSTCSLALLSAVSILVAFAQRIYSPTPNTVLDNYLSSFAVGVGILLLVVSLLEWGARYGAKAEALHRSAELVTSFQIKVAMSIAAIDAGHSATLDEVDQLRVEYDEIKDKCGENHDPRDDALFRASHRHDRDLWKGGNVAPGWLGAKWTYVKWVLAETWFFALIWLVVAGGLAYSIWLPKA